MKGKTISAILVILALALLPTMSASVARTPKPVTITGYLSHSLDTPPFYTTSYTVVGNTCYWSFTDDAYYTGDISGTSHTVGSWVMHGCDYATFGYTWASMSYVETFDSANVLGQTGGLTLKFTGIIVPWQYSGYFGTLVIIGSTGGLANLHGQGIEWSGWWVPASPTAEHYSMQVYYG